MGRVTKWALVVAGLAVPASAAPPVAIDVKAPSPYTLSVGSPSYTIFLGKSGRRSYLVLRNAASVQFLSGAVSMRKGTGAAMGVVDMVIAPLVGKDKVHLIRCKVAGTANVSFEARRLVSGAWKSDFKIRPVVGGIAEWQASIGDEYYQLSLASTEPGSGGVASWGFDSCTVSVA